MERVTGIGGFFFRAKDPKKLSDWYEKHLGISRVPKTYEEGSWWQNEGPTVIDAFDDQNEFLGKHKKSWIINFRVNDLDAIVVQLTNAGIKIETDPENYPNGRFAYLTDPEGNPIQLWEVAGTDLVRP
jgi:glyoxylase I family protein